MSKAPILAFAAAPLLALAVAGSASAATGATLYVNSRTGNDSASCTSSAPCRTISHAVSIARPGDTISVAPGNGYREDVVVTTSDLAIVATGAVVDNLSGVSTTATAGNNGFTIRASDVTVRGFTVENAVGEGILVQRVGGARIIDNTVISNDRGQFQKNPSYPQCQASGSVPGDCGEGIHLMSAANSIVSGNLVRGNSGGILLSDELGPTDRNTISDNQVLDNVYDCGITLASHNNQAAPGGVPAPSKGGIYYNRIIGNVLDGNGTAGFGAGILLAGAGAPPPGSHVPSGFAAYDNLIESNVADGNGLGGVTLHAHFPGVDFNGNQIVDNSFSGNDTKGDNGHPGDISTAPLLAPPATFGPPQLQSAADVIIYAAATEVTGTVVRDNTFSYARYGIWSSNAPALLAGNRMGAGISQPALQLPPTSVTAVTGTNSEVYALTPATGPGWLPLHGVTRYAPAVAIPAAGQPLYVATSTNSLTYVRSASQDWQRFTSSLHCVGSPAAYASGGTLYVACEVSGGRLEVASGSIPSKGLPTATSITSLGGRLLAAPAIAPVGGQLTYFAVGLDSHLYSRTADTGWVRLQLVCSTAPSAAAAGNTTIAACADQGPLVYTMSVRGGWSSPARVNATVVGVPAIVPGAPVPYFLAESTDSGVWSGTAATGWSFIGGRVMGGVAAATG
ncbi:MAG: right-handed parallel beta-helix repeat-containing protein [Mycobacteriales bacterium]